MSSKQKKRAAFVTFYDQKDRQRSLEVPSRQWGWEWHQQGNQLLIVPTAGARWSRADPLWRSVLLRHQPRTDKAEVISLGLPKFWEPHQSLESVQALEADLLKGLEFSATIKYDGQLLIRSVHHGKVIFRSRGRADLDQALQVSLQRLLPLYPLLSDPNFAPELSLQFELCLKNQRIVIEYPEDQLIMIGASSHRHLAAVSWPRVIELAKEIGISQAQRIPLLGVSVAQWQKQLADLSAEGLVGEGLVIRDDTGRPRLRLKTKSYQKLFRLRFDYPPARIAKTILREQKRGEQGLTERVLKSLNIHSDDSADIKEQIKAFHDLENKSLAKLETLQRTASEYESLSKNKFSKEVAHNYPVPEGPALICLYEGRSQQAYELIFSYDRNRLLEELVDKLSL